MSRHRRSSCISRSIASCIAVLLAGTVVLSGSAQANDGGHPVLQTEQPTKIVQIAVPDARQLSWLIEEVGVNPLACRPGPGFQHFHASVEQLEQIAQAGLQFDIEVNNAEAMFAAERARIEANNAQRGQSWFTDYKTYAQINAKIDELVTLRPDLVTKLTVGTTHEGRTIYGMRISGPGTSKPAVLFNGTQHAREWVSPMTNMFIAVNLVEQYDSNPVVQQLVDGVEIFIVPVVNPDGYEYTWNTYRLWRKNRRDNGGGEYGVDLNRNWDIDWNGGESTSTNPSSDVYVGPAPFSEPESSALRDFFNAHPNILAHVDFHSYSQIILYAWGHTPVPPPDEAVQEALGEAMHNAAIAVNGYAYPFGNGGDLIYLASGTCSDWTYSQGAAGFTIELRPDCCTFELPAAEIIPTGEEMFEAALTMAQWAATPLAVAFPDGQPDIVAPDEPTTFDVEIASRHGETLDPATAKLQSRTISRGAFTETPLTHLGGDMYQGEFPAGACGDTIEFYLQIDTDGSETRTEPSNAPTDVLTVLVTDQFFAINDDFESDLGWDTPLTNATSGFWERGEPVNDPNWNYDPSSDSDGSGQCWLTENEFGNTDVDNGSVKLVSPLINMSSGTDADQWQVSYDYYLHLTDTSSTDALFVEVSSNGVAGPWIEVRRHDSHGGLSWHQVEITEDELLAAGVTLTDNMLFRFTAADDDPQSIVEAGVDAFSVDRTGCDEPIIPGDIAEPFGVVDVFDLILLLKNWNTSGPGADIEPPLDVVNVFDLVTLLENWG